MLLGLLARRKALRLAAAAFMLLAMVGEAVVRPPKAESFFTGLRGPYISEVLYYTADATFWSNGFFRDVAERANQAWQAQDVYEAEQFLPDWDGYLGGARRLQASWLDGKYGGAAFATIGCRSQLPYCEMVFDLNETWNTTDQFRNSEWLDFRSVATHEFGHWMGSDHSYDIPITDGGAYSNTNTDDRPVMWPGINYGVKRRGIRQDDAAAVKASRWTSPINIGANKSFEFAKDPSDTNPRASKFFGWLFRGSSRGGSSSRYCSAYSTYWGTCYMEYNGNGAGGSSVYQDVHNYVGGGSIPGEHGNNQPAWQRDRNLTFSVAARNRGSQLTSVTVAVWALDRNNLLVASYGCTLPNGANGVGVWVTCSTPAFRQPLNPDNTRLRIEVYNNGAENVDIDNSALVIQYP